MDYCLFCQTKQSAHVGKDMRCPTRKDSHFKAEPKVRNAFALHATSRKAGYMKHRNEPKGGARNKQREYREDD